MTSSDFIKSEAFKNRINTVIDSMVNVTDEQSIKPTLEPLLARLFLDSFNDGIIANMTEKKKISKENLVKKSKEITNWLPAHFKKTETGKKLVELMLAELLNNTTDYVLNIGYETILEDCFNKVLRIAYSIGITTGFEIASDDELKRIYTANVERFMNSGEIGKE